MRWGVVGLSSIFFMAKYEFVIFLRECVSIMSGIRVCNRYSQEDQPVLALQWHTRASGPDSWSSPCDVKDITFPWVDKKSNGNP